MSNSFVFNIYVQELDQASSKVKKKVLIIMVNSDCDMSLKILSANCQGLGGINKRRDVLNDLKRKKFDVFCLQDTHFTFQRQQNVKTIWRGKCFFSSFSSKSRGVAILFNENFVGTVSREKKDCGGNYLMLELTIRGKNFLLCSLYGPNKDTPAFYEELQKNIEGFNCERVIICGDFNLVLNPELDYFNYRRTNNRRARKRVLELIKDNNFVDIFRANNPDAKKFTWRRETPLKQGRLDYFLISENLLSWFPESFMIPSHQSDHLRITLNLKFNDFQKGEVSWKFDNSLLKNRKFLNLMYKTIKEFKEKNLTKKKHQLVLEKLLKKIKGEVVEYEKKYSESVNENRGWVKELESRNILSGIIPRLKLENGIFIYKQSNILKKAKKYFEIFYENDSIEVVNLQVYLPFSNIRKLSDEESSSLEGLITLKEAKETLDRMKSDESPGSDGLTVDFFQFFWPKLGDFVVQSINNGYDHKMLSETQRHGIITCFPKEDKPKHFLENWRPVYQLNTVYKIASGSIAYRIHKHLDKIIHPDQTCLIHCQEQTENIRLLFDIMQYTEEKNISGLLLLVDCEKAFNSLSWSFIQKSLEFFNFGESICKWISSFYSGITAAVNLGENISETFNLYRGCRKGDPLSPYLFRICVESLAIKLRESKDIKGINFFESRKKIAMFADDFLILILDGTEKSLLSSLDILKEFAKLSGVKISFDQTQVVWIGAKKSCNAKLCPKEPLIWGCKNFNLFGIIMNTELTNILYMNFDLKFKEIKKRIRHWKCCVRNLTCSDRFKFLKTHLLPMFNDIFATLPNPSNSQLKYLENEFYSFVGCKIEFLDDAFNIRKIIMTKKLEWMKKVIHKSSKLDLILDLDVKKIILFGEKYIQCKIKKVKNMFWRDVLTAWLFFCDKVRKTFPCTSMEPLFFNTNILVQNKTIFYQKWFENNVYFVNDVLKVNGSFMELKDFKLKYGIRLRTRTYERLIAAIKECHRLNSINSNNNLSLTKLCMPYIPQKVYFLLKAKDLYEILKY